MRSLTSSFFLGAISAAILAPLSGVLSGCSKKQPSSSVAPYTSYKANGSFEELSVLSDSMPAVYTPVHISQSCSSSDSAQVVYGCGYDRHDSGGRIIKSVSLYFYFSDLKSRLAEHNGLSYYSDLVEVTDKLGAGQLNYLAEMLCLPVEAVGLVYFDQSGFYRTWTLSPLVNPRQDSSSFQINSLEIIDHAVYGHCIKIEGGYSCKVYSTSGDSLVISEGKFTGIINNPI